MDREQDERMMARAARGEVDALGLLFERHHRALYRFFHHLAGPGATAEDLTQEVFFRMLKFRATYRDGAAFAPWMYQIARNVHVDHLRRRRNETPLADGEAVREPAASAELALVRSSELAMLRRAWMRLPADKRELLVLSRWQGLPYAQIADIVQCEPGAVKTRVFRAMRQLAELYQKLGGRRAS